MKTSGLMRPATPEEMPDDVALKLRDDVVASMIADACEVMPPMRQLALCGASPFAMHRALLADAPVHPLRMHTIMLRAGLLLGAIRIDDCPTIGKA